jgi:hypothetical protein
MPVFTARASKSPKVKSREDVQRLSATEENMRLRREYAANPDAMTDEDRARGEILAARDKRKRLEKQANSGQNITAPIKLAKRSKSARPNGEDKEFSSQKPAKPSKPASTKKDAKKAQEEPDPADVSKLRSEVKLLADWANVAPPRCNEPSVSRSFRPKCVAGG